MKEMTLSQVQDSMRGVAETQDGQVMLQYLEFKFGYVNEPMHRSGANPADTVHKDGNREVIIHISRLIHGPDIVSPTDDQQEE